jgi:hypothetical protein
MVTSKSTLTVARLALQVAQQAFTDYAYPKSPHKFSQPQLLACLVIKEFRRLDYRSTAVLLAEWSDLRAVLGLQRVPHFTTLQQAARRLLGKGRADALLASVLALCRRKKLLPRRSRLAAIDATGLETRHISAYYTHRCGRHRGHRKHRYPKVSAICDTASHLILGAVIDRGPKPDVIEDEATLDAAWRQQKFTTLLGDAGYESERFHRRCRQGLGVRSIIPTTQRGRPRKDGQPRPVNGRYRKLMKHRFPKKTYGQRWQIETVFSMLKRNLGAALRARHYHSQTREIRLRLLTHNLMILRSVLMFHTEQHARPQPECACSGPSSG